MPGTWKERSKKHIGYVAPPTYVNQEYVTAHYVQELLDKGYSTYEIGLIYNGGEPKAKACYTCKVKYDSGAYAQKLVALVNN